MEFKIPFSSNDKFKSHWAIGKIYDMATVSVTCEKLGNRFANIIKTLNSPNLAASMASSKSEPAVSKMYI